MGNHTQLLQIFLIALRSAYWRISFRSKRHDHREALIQDEDEDLDYAGALEQFVVSSTHLIGEVKEDAVDGVTSTDDGLPQNEAKPQATYIVINSHDYIQLTVTMAALDVLTSASTVSNRNDIQTQHKAVSATKTRKRKCHII